MDDWLVIRVEWQPTAALNPNYHKGWRGKHPDQQTARATAIAATREVMRRRQGWVLPDHPVLEVVIAWGKGKKRKDSDNALASCKHAIDGMCAELGFDDNRFLTSRAFQRRDPEKKGWVEFIIRPATREERQLAA